MRLEAALGAALRPEALLLDMDGVMADVSASYRGAIVQTAARFIAPFGRWRRMEDARAALMRAELERIVAAPGVSRDTFEMASKSLA